MAIYMTVDKNLAKMLTGVLKWNLPIDGRKFSTNHNNYNNNQIYRLQIVTCKAIKTKNQSMNSKTEDKAVFALFIRTGEVYNLYPQPFLCKLNPDSKWK